MQKAPLSVLKAKQLLHKSFFKAQSLRILYDATVCGLLQRRTGFFAVFHQYCLASPDASRPPDLIINSVRCG
jgi:hypothetical protein